VPRLSLLAARLLTGLTAALGIKVMRAGRPENRFDAMRETLQGLAARGFAPDLVLDAGANVGRWAGLARAIFPDALFHLIEPQAGCQTALMTFAGSAPTRITIHPVALAAPGIESVRMIVLDPSQHGTGSFVAAPGEFTSDPSVTYPATTLDELFAARIVDGARVLLKMDLEGHELPALHGAERLLPLVEVLVLEVRFFDPFRTGRAVCADLLAFLDERGFALYDVAALSARPRDGRLKMGDLVLVRLDSPLAGDVTLD